MTTAPTSNASATANEALAGAASALEAAIDADAETPGWLAVLEARVRNVESAVAAHRAVSEAPGGSLEVIAARKPGLIPRLDRQREEHVEFLTKADRLASIIADGQVFQKFDPERLRLEARILADSVRLHMLLGAELMSEAFLQEEGGEGG